MEFIIGVIINDEVRFYKIADGDALFEYKDASFKLPDGYESVIGLSEERLGVYVDNVLRIYEIDDFWEENPELRFTRN